MRVEDVTAERCGELCQCRLSRCDQIMGYGICVDERDAEFCKEPADRGFSAADAAGQSDAQHGSRLGGYAKQVGLGDVITPQQGDPASRGQVRAKGNRELPVTTAKQDQGDANHGANQ